jgi:hypothetical protein
MKGTYIRLVSSLLVGILVAFVALGFSGCADAAEDCHNTLTCPPPADCLEAGDAKNEIDGCF